MADLTNAERETHISMCADDRSMWAIGTDDAYWQRRFEAVGAATGGSTHCPLTKSACAISAS